jgi:hypothetical protein
MTFFIDDEPRYEIGSLHLLEGGGCLLLVEIISSNAMQLHAYMYALPFVLAIQNKLQFIWNCELAIAYDYKIKNNNIVLKGDFFDSTAIVKLSIPYSTEPDINVKIDNAIKYINSTFNP